jgi:hypothetical protein
MVMYRCRYCGKSFTRHPDQQQAQRLYTPTMDGFERFACAMVGLNTGTPEAGQQKFRQDPARRNAR